MPGLSANPRLLRAIPAAHRYGYIIGWRWWRVDRGGLYSLWVGVGSAWPTGQALWAGTKLHPDPRNYWGQCGIYAWRTAEQALRQRMPTGYDLFVLGEVALWGHVIEHERGYRAEYAYPYSFRVAAALPGAYAPLARVAVAAKLYQPRAGVEIRRLLWLRKATLDVPFLYAMEA